MAALLGALAAGLTVYSALGAPPVPAPTISAFPANPTNSQSASFTYTDSAAITKFQCSLDGSSFSDCGTTRPSTKNYPGPLAAGSHTFRVRAVSGSSTSSATPYSWLIDRTAPTVVSINRAAASPTNAASVPWTVTFSEPVTEVASNGSNFSLVAVGLTGSPAITGASGSSATYTVNATTGTGTTGPTNTLQLRLSSAGAIKDAAGNGLAGAPFNGQRYTIDKTPPPVPSITSGPLQPPSGWPSRSATFQFSDSESGVAFLCSLDGGADTACSSPKTYSGLSQGTHHFQVTARDAAGNASGPSALWTWVVDTVPPNKPTLTQTPPNPSSSQTATFAWTGTDPAPGSGIATYACKLDNGSRQLCSSPTTYTNLTFSSHTFSVVAVDGAGNVSRAATYNWTVSQTQGLPFTIGATTSSLLYPGGADVPVNLVFRNPNGSPLTITSVTMTVTGTNTASCPLALANVTVSHQLSQSVGPIPPGNVPTSLSDLGVPQSAWPELHMGDTGTNQDLCQGINVNLSFSGVGNG